MSLKKAIDNLKYDARMVEINLKSQNLTKDEMQKHLSQLPDTKMQSIVVDLENDDIDSMGDE